MKTPKVGSLWRQKKKSPGANTYAIVQIDDAQPLICFSEPSKPDSGECRKLDEFLEMFEPSPWPAEKKAKVKR